MSYPEPFANASAYRKMKNLEAENARLKAEVERLTERNKFLEQIDSFLQGANENAYEKRCDELEAENARLKAEVERSRDQYNGIIDTQLKVIEGKQDVIDKLHIEVERLRKAGDAMAKTIGENGVHDNGSFHDVADSIDRWHAAKDGKQP